jgi:hypothetical protein
MYLKFIAAFVVAFALLPSIAQAANSPEVTYPTGTRLAVGTKIKGQNVGEPHMTFNLGTLYCSTFNVTGTLAKNTVGEVEADIETAEATGTSAGGACTNPKTGTMTWTFSSITNGVPWCLRSTPTMAEDEVQIRGGKCSEAARPIRIVEDGFGCILERSSAMVGTLKTDPETAVVSFSNQTFKRANICFFGSDVEFGFALAFERDEGFGGALYFS